jgi:hypothetical protein
MRIAAFLLLAAAIWIPVIRWSRMSETARYIAMFIAGAAFLFYLQHPTHTACEEANTCDQSGY